MIPIFYKTSILILVLSCFSHSVLIDYKEIDINQKIDSIASIESDCTLFSKSLKTKNEFIVISFRTIKKSKKEIERALLSYNAYPDMFRYVKRFEFINDTKENKQFFFESRSPFFKFWSILKIDTVFSQKRDNEGQKIIYLSKDKGQKINTQYNKKYMKNKRCIENNDCNFIWYIKENGGNSSRIGIIFHTVLKSSVPGWIVKIVTKKAIPNFLKDIEKASVAN